MNRLKLLFIDLIILFINIPKLVMRNSDSFNFYLLSIKNKLKTRGTKVINNRIFEFETDSVKTYQRFTKLLNKEPDTILWIDSFDKNDVFWDIGANVGVFSFYAGYNGIKTFSFEPDPLNYKELSKMLILNNVNNISPFLIGVGTSQLGYFNLEFVDDGLDSGRSMRTLNTSGITNPNLNYIKTLTMSLNSLVELLFLDFPNHIKIDVDGNEIGILDNQFQFLNNPKLKSVLIELDESDQSSLNRIIDIMKRCNFVIYKSFSTATGSKFINYIFRKS
jgi:FkbM family methyltransferase